MTEQELIEEMAKVISGSTEIDTMDYYNARIKAKELYRIVVPEGAVVVTKKQNEITTAFIKCLQRRIDELNELHINRYKQARKETAREILEKARKKMLMVDGAVALAYAVGVIDKLAKEYGVEVSE